MFLHGSKRMSRTDISLSYHKAKQGHGNFGDEISKHVVGYLTDFSKYRLVYNTQAEVRLVCVGSYIQNAREGSYIFGSGVRSDPPTEGGHFYKDLKVKAIRGPLSREFLLERDIECPEIYGDPALLLPMFYQPEFIPSLRDKILFIRHMSKIHLYID